MDHLETYILGLNLGNILELDPNVPVENKDKVEYAAALIIEMSPVQLDNAANNLRTAFNNAVKEIYEKHGLTDIEIELAVEGIGRDILDPETANKLQEISNNMYTEFAKEAPEEPVAGRLRSSDPPGGMVVEEFQEQQPGKERQDLISLEAKKRPEATITLDNGQEYTYEQLKNMDRFRTDQTPHRYVYTEEDRNKIKDFYAFVEGKKRRIGGKKARKTKKARKNK